MREDERRPGSERRFLSLHDRLLLGLVVLDLHGLLRNGVDLVPDGLLDVVGRGGGPALS